MNDAPVKSEYKFQVSIINWLRGLRRSGKQKYEGTKPMPEVFACHVFQGRSKEDGYFLQELGVFPGVADILNVWRHPKRDLLIELSKKYNVDIPLYEVGFLELKSENGKLSAPQIKFKGICHWLGVKWAMAKNEGEVVRAYKQWGHKPSHTAIQTPDYRTQEEKFKQVFDMYAPVPNPDSAPRP